MSSSSADDSKPRILIVDDSAATAQALAKILAAASYRTTIAVNGKEALKRAVDPDGFSAAVVDIHLGDLNGLVVAQKLREVLGSDVPILILSGDSSVETLNSLHLIGVTYFFSKPVNTAHLLQSLKDFIRVRTGAA